VYPYEKLQAIVQDGFGNWKWLRMWQRLDELERRGPAYRTGEKLHFDLPNKNPNVVPQNVLIVGGGPIGIRMAIELVLGGHKATIFEKRREKRADDGSLETLGFTNRINRPHMWAFVRHDLSRLGGRDFMSPSACYPVFTEPDTSSIGVDELQMVLLKNALMLGVKFLIGVAYDDAKVITHPKTMKPSWNVECTVDEGAAKQFDMPAGKNQMTFDCLVGCDGPRSTVRTTQSKIFGEITTRKFMDAVGIVANIRKLSKSRLRDLDFDNGQEPKDMNRTNMVFKDFFDKIRDEADADLDNLIYYKASFHYYVILTPKRANLIKHGLTGKLYHFEANARPHTVEEKSKLKLFVKNVVKAAGIPFDEEMDNGGFVDAPNDVMAFDFAECWNTKTNMAFSLPPPSYDTEKDGPWTGKELHPFIALAGDALFEAFWPEGLGLKRGWHAIMDSCYAIDNLYNKGMFADTIGKKPEDVEWGDHYAALHEQNRKNYEMLHRRKFSEDCSKGEFDRKGLVITQLNKLIRDAEVPLFEVEVDPWTRYEDLNVEREKEHKRAALDFTTLHPVVAKAVAKHEFYRKMSVGDNKKGEIKYNGKELISIGGREVLYSDEEEGSGSDGGSDADAGGYPKSDAPKSLLGAMMTANK